MDTGKNIRNKCRIRESGGLPVTDLGKVFRLDSCQKQKDMCWDYEGFVLAHKKVNPDFDPKKPFVVVINIPGAVRGERDGWQLHFENFGDMPKDAKAFDDMYKAVAASCPAGRSLYLSGGCTPGGIAGLSKLEDYGFKKEWLPYGGSIVYWGGDVIDPGKFDKWLNGGRHDGDFLVKKWSEDGEWVLRPPKQGDELTEQNTQPRPFKMVRTSAAVNENIEREKTMKKQYTKKQITEAIAYWEKQLKLGNCKKLDEAGSADEELLKKAGHEALDDIEKNIEKHVKHDYGMDRVQPGSVARAFFDYIKAEPYGFSFKFKEHAHGIGNNSEWSIIKNGKTVGSFWCTDDMFGGVFAGVDVGGEVVDQRKFKYVYVPPEEYVPDGDALTWKELHRIFEDTARKNPDIQPSEWCVEADRLGGEGLILNDPVNDAVAYTSNGRRRLAIVHVDSLADKGKGWLSLDGLAKATEKYAQEDPDGAAKLIFGYMRHRGQLSMVFDYNGKHVSGKVRYLKYAEFDPDDAVFSFGVLPVKKVSESAPELGKKSRSTEKKSYTRKQIAEAIAYWEKRLDECGGV